MLLKGTMSEICEWACVCLCQGERGMMLLKEPMSEICEWACVCVCVCVCVRACVRACVRVCVSGRARHDVTEGTDERDK